MKSFLAYVASAVILIAYPSVNYLTNPPAAHHSI
jgi:hypothetical protein